jgi:acid phosphatase (class A)
MIRTLSLILALAAAPALVLPADARMASGTASHKTKTAGTPSLLAPDALRPEWLLPAPPADDSAQGQAELSEVKRIATEASPEVKAAADKDGATENVTFFADTLPGFDVARLPATKKLFEEIANEEDQRTKIFKAYFGRRRPYQRDASIPLCPSEGHGSAKPNSYPSGHTTLAFSMGVVLAQLMPERGQAILGRSRLYAEHRMVCGVHFRSDLVAGQALGTAMALKLMDVPSFKADYDAAKAELVQAGLTK